MTENGNRFLYTLKPGGLGCLGVVANCGRVAGRSAGQYFCLLRLTDRNRILKRLSVTRRVRWDGRQRGYWLREGAVTVPLAGRVSSLGGMLR